MWYSRFVHFFVGVALSGLVASIFLIFRIKAGAVEGFAQNMLVALLLAVVVPLATMLAYSAWRRGGPGRAYVFHGVCALLALALGFATF